MPSRPFAIALVALSLLGLAFVTGSGAERDAGGAPVPSGLYFYVLETDGGLHSTRRMVLLR